VWVRVRGRGRITEVFAVSLGGWTVPLWVYDWSGSILVVISLVPLFHKRRSYWWWSNASLVPYGVLFYETGQWMLLGLQFSYLLFGFHGLYLWYLENRRDQTGQAFAEVRWYAATWVISIGIFVYTVAVTNFAYRWNWVQFAAVSAALVANFATTRKWSWSWPVWILVNAIQSVYFAHLGLWAQFGVQFVLAAMSIYGWRTWRTHDRAHEIDEVAFA
jgi:nicotinamide mononucleotide transporter